MDKKKLRQYISAICSSVAAGIVFIVLVFVLNWNIVLDIVLAMGVYAGLYFITKPPRKIGNTEIDFIGDGSKLEEKFEKAKNDYYSISLSTGKIQEYSVRVKAENLLETLSYIMKYLEDNPKMIRNADDFIDYYMSSAVKILHGYIDIQSTNLKTDEINKMKEETITAIVTLHEAFKIQFEKIVRGEITDFKEEITQLDKAVKTENNKKCEQK